MAVRVLIVDDHPLFRAGLRAALDSSSDVCVVGESATGEEAVAAVAADAPDVVLLDLGLPDISGIEVMHRLPDKVAVLILTMSTEDDSLLAAMRAGARGYLVKGMGREEVLHAVGTVAAGGVVFAPEMAGRLTSLLSAPAPAGHVFPTLTPREREILDLVARGMNNHHIARELFLAEKTVRNHVARIFEKLQVTSRAEAVARARDAGLGVS